MYVVVCRGPNCRARGALPLRKRLVELLRHDADVRLLGYSCFGQCDDGPNVAFFRRGEPGEWYGGLSGVADAERVADYARGGRRFDAPALRLPEEERAEHQRNVQELIRTHERDRARPHHWWWPF